MSPSSLIVFAPRQFFPSISLAQLSHAPRAAYPAMLLGSLLRTSLVAGIVHFGALNITQNLQSSTLVNLLEPYFLRGRCRRRVCPRSSFRTIFSNGAPLLEFHLGPMGHNKKASSRQRKNAKKRAINRNQMHFALSAEWLRRDDSGLGLDAQICSSIASKYQ